MLGRGSITRRGLGVVEFLGRRQDALRLWNLPPWRTVSSRLQDAPRPWWPLAARRAALASVSTGNQPCSPIVVSQLILVRYAQPGVSFLPARP